MLNSRFLSTVSNFISTHRLLDRSGKCLVALSGGADSVALTLTLRQLGYDTEAAHCNFHLRGDESERDENFCVCFCKEQGIKLHIAHFDTMSYAKLHKVSIEMAARNLRYAYFRNLKTDLRAQAICVAHHKDDSVETVLMNLIRGTGINGLTGIAARNNDIVRPLLCVSRSEIEAALDGVGQAFVTDSTNLVDDVVRNKIRLDIIPLMKKINPSVCDSISKTAERLRDVAKTIDAITEHDAKCVIISDNCGIVKLSIPRLLSSHSPEHLLYSLLRPYKFNPTQVEQIFSAAAYSAGKVFSSKTHRLLIDRDCMIIEPAHGEKQRQFSIPEDGIYLIDDAHKLRVELTDYDPAVTINKSRGFLYADANLIEFPLTVRCVSPGDRFIPFGMRGSKLVSDYMTDIKLSLFDKQRQLVLTDFSGRIVWLVNQRPDNRFRISCNTSKLLVVEYITY